MAHKDHWYAIVAGDSSAEAAELEDDEEPLPPVASVEGYHKLERFFETASCLMGKQLRSAVEASLDTFCDLLAPYIAGNALPETGYADFMFVQAQLVEIQAVPGDDGEFAFEPSLEEVHASLLSACDRIALGGQGFARVETKIFPGLGDSDMDIMAPGEDDERIHLAKRHVSAVVEANMDGPRGYMQGYDKYRQLLRPAEGSASELEREVAEFLSTDKSLAKCSQYIETLTALREEILALRSTVALGLFRLDATDLHEELAERVQAQIDVLVGSIVERARRHNHAVCDQYDATSNRLMEKPTTTEDMTALDEFLATVRSETIFKLKDQVEEAKEYMRFLMKYGDLSTEDVKLNTTTLKWPERLEPIFDVTNRRIDEHKASAEIALKKRIGEFERLLDDYAKQVDAFKDKGDVLRSDEIARNVKMLDVMTDNLAAAKKEVCKGAGVEFQSHCIILSSSIAKRHPSSSPLPPPPPPSHPPSTSLRRKTSTRSRSCWSGT